MIRALTLVAVLTVPALAQAQEYSPGATGIVPLQSIRGSSGPNATTCVIFDVHTTAGAVRTFAVQPGIDAWKITLIIARTQANLPVTVVTAGDYHPPLQEWLYPPTIPCPAGVSAAGVVGSADFTFAAGIR